jgi:hypothetical protein
MKIILNNRIDHLNIKNKEPIHSTRIIRTMYYIVAQLSLSLYIYIYEPFNILMYRECYYLIN